LNLGSSRPIPGETGIEDAKPAVPQLRVTWLPTDLYGGLLLLRRYWHVVVVAALAGAAGMLAAFVVLGPSYTVSAKILARPGPEIAASPLLAARDGAPAASIRRPEDIASVVEILTDPRLIRATIDSLGDGFFADDPPATLFQHVKAIAKATMGAMRAAMRQATVIVGLRPPTTQTDRFVLAIGAGLRVEPVRRTDVIEVTLFFPDPRAGEVILTRFIELALADHVQAYRMPGAADFFADGVAAQRAALARAERRLLEARGQATAVWSANEQRSMLLRGQADLRLLHQQALTAAAETEAELGAAEATLAGLAPRIEVSAVRARNRAVDDLRGWLVQLRIDQGGQRARYGDSSPEVVELNRQIDTVLAALAGEPEYRLAEVTDAANPAYQALEREVTTKRILRAGQRARVDQLAQEIARLGDELERLAAAAIGIGQMELEVARLRRTVELYEKGLDDARIAEAMETVQLSGLRVVMPPMAEIIPSSPSIRRGVLIGSVAGVVLSGLVIVWLEYRRRPKVPPGDDVVVS